MLAVDCRRFAIHCFIAQIVAGIVLGILFVFVLLLLHLLRGYSAAAPFASNQDVPHAADVEEFDVCVGFPSRVDLIHEGVVVRGQEFVVRIVYRLAGRVRRRNGNCPNRLGHASVILCRASDVIGGLPSLQAHTTAQQDCKRRHDSSPLRWFFCLAHSHYGFSVCATLVGYGEKSRRKATAPPCHQKTSPSNPTPPVSPVTGSDTKTHAAAPHRQQVARQLRPAKALDETSPYHSAIGPACWSPANSVANPS